MELDPGGVGPDAANQAQHPVKRGRRYRTVLVLSDHGATGGARDYLRRLLDLYKSLGWRILLVAPQDSDASLSPEGPNSRTISASDILGAGVGFRSPWQLLGRRRERNCLQRFCREEDVDLVVASAGTPGALMGAVQGITPSLYVLHTYPHGLRARLFGRIRFRRAFADVNAVVTVSDAARREVMRLWSPRGAEKKIESVHSTVGSPPSLSRDRGDKNLVVSLGHVVSYKGPDVFIRMAALLAPRFPDVHFVWAGDGPLLEECQAEVRARGLEGRIRFVGHVDDVADLYRRALVYVQPSRIESLGLALLDAGRYGVPSVVPNVGGMPEVVMNLETGLVVPSPSGALMADAVSQILTHSSLGESLGIAAQQKYVHEFSEERWATRMLEVHQRVLAESPD